MNWLKKTLRRSTIAETRAERDIRFLGEQDGLPEQEIKARWKPILASFPDILRAYLAIVSFDGSQTYQVALCIRSRTSDDLRLVDALAQPFREMFNNATPLDIMFLNETEEEQVKSVCRAFYQAT